MTELDTLGDALAMTGADRALLADSRVGHLVAVGHQVLSQRVVPGLHMEVHETADGLVAQVIVTRGSTIKNPVHLCIGMLQRVGNQRITMTVHIEPHATATVISHCLFPAAEQVQHTMEAVVEIGEGATLYYREGHYHGRRGGTSVEPKVLVHVGPSGRYLSDFSLTRGRVGQLTIDYTVETAAHAVAELTARVFGHGTDAIHLNDRLILSGTASRGLIKTRIALEDEATAEVTSITEGRAARARGHMDCLEIVKDRAAATAIPMVKVYHPLAKITHEAAIGSVDQKQLETLMAHGLTPEQAVEMIVSGLLR